MRDQGRPSRSGFGISVSGFGILESGILVYFGNWVDDFGGGEGCGHGRVYIADDHDEVGPLLHEHLFIGHQDLARLLRVGAVAHAKVDVGLGQARSSKKESDILTS